MATGTQLIYRTLGQGIQFLNDKYKEVHMPLSTPIVVHSSTTVCFKTLPFLDRNNHSLKYLQGWPTEVTKMAQWASSIWQKTRYTLARLHCSSWNSNAAQRKQLVSNNKILHRTKEQNCALFFLRTWECDNQPASKKLQRLCFPKRKKKKIKKMAGKAMKLHHSQWRFCTTVKV